MHKNVSGHCEISICLPPSQGMRSNKCQTILGCECAPSLLPFLPDSTTVHPIVGMSSGQEAILFLHHDGTHSPRSDLDKAAEPAETGTCRREAASPYAR